MPYTLILFLFSFPCVTSFPHATKTMYVRYDVRSNHQKHVFSLFGLPWDSKIFTSRKIFFIKMKKMTFFICGWNSFSFTKISQLMFNSTCYYQHFKTYRQHLIIPKYLNKTLFSYHPLHLLRFSNPGSTT